MAVRFINPFMVVPGSLLLEITGTATYQSSADATSHTLNLPSGIVAGERLLLVIGKSSTLAQNCTTPAGWTQLINENQAQGALHVYTRIADGSEGATLSLTTSAATAVCCMAFRMKNAASATGPAIGTTATGSSTAPNPPSLTPSWGSARNLWIAFGGIRSTAATVSAWPTGYTNNQTSLASTGGTTNRLFLATKYATGTVDDPATFTLSASVSWRSNTLAVRPV
jgi:hypothetical protein